MSSDATPNSIKRVLITGATSFPGRKLARAMRDRGDLVHALVRPSSDTSAIDDVARIHTHDGSAASMDAIVSVARPDIVVHLATLYLRNHESDQVAPLIETNVTLGAQLLDAMSKHGCNRFVTLGTYFEYFGEHEDKAVNLYAATKQAFSSILHYYQDAAAIDATELVMFDGYGEGDPRRKLMWAVRNAMRTGEPIALPDRTVHLDLVHVDDVVGAIRHVIDAGITGGPYALSSGKLITIEGLVDLFEDVAGRSITRTPGGFAVPVRNPDQPWRGPQIPGWQPSVSLNDGIKRFLQEDVASED